MTVQSKLQIIAALLLALAGVAGCVVKETRPQPKLSAIQASAEIPDKELLDVAIRVLDSGIPKDIENNPDELDKKRLYPDIRKAEARFFANALRDTLAGSGQWGAVRVVPEAVQFVDVLVNGKIVESNGARLALAMDVRDSAGRAWLNKTYQADADDSSYRDAAATKARDPFANVYAEIANDLLAARNKLTAAERQELRQISELEFARDLSPEAFNGYLKADDKGVLHIVRLPANDDPMMSRVRKVRERDGSLIDTVSDQYATFAEQIGDSYNGWRRESYSEVLKEDKLRRQAKTRTIMGAAAVIGAIFVPSHCAPDNYNCRRIDSAARTAAVSGGIYGVLSGLQKRAEAKNHAATIKELAGSLNGEVASQVVEVEGRTLKLTGSAEQQYGEWRKLLRDIYKEETGAVTATAPPAAPAAPAVPAAAPAAAAPPATKPDTAPATREPTAGPHG
jgi:hypothetical protein